MEIIKKTKETSNKAVKATNGKKTYVAVFMMVIMALVGDKVPILAKNQILIEQLIEYLAQLGLLHKAWRNRKEIWAAVKSWVKKIKK